MRHAAIVLSFVLIPSLADAEPKLTLRPLDPLAAETLARAIDGSATVRDLAARLDASNVIVHIEVTAHMPAGIGGMTRFVTSRGGYRYLRITLGSEMTLRIRSAILGHELKHACEVADSPASDARSMRELFESEGHRAGPYFETMAAIRVERDVLLQLGAPAARARSTALQAEPVVKFDH
jgi:hypothetical protein